MRFPGVPITKGRIPPSFAPSPVPFQSHQKEEEEDANKEKNAILAF
jgi:hypothetical protein